MKEISKIYLNFEGDIPDFDDVDEGDWYITIKGDPVTDVMLQRLTGVITELVKKYTDNDDIIEYYDICCDAEEFMVREYGYERYNEPCETYAIEVKV